MSPWFRRRRAVPEQPAPEPETAQEGPREEPEQAPDSTAPLSSDRLDNALKRLRQEIPAPSEERPAGPSE